MKNTTRALLFRVLDEPGLVTAVRALPPVQLDALVRAVGLEDAGELLAMATSEQFVHLVDESLWRGQGVEEVFDHARFPIWLEIMFEGGEELVARRLHELPEESVALAFAGQLLVFDIETLGMGMAGASDRAAALVERALDACLYLELDNYTLVARRSLGWDVVIAALLALDQRDHAFALRILEACRFATEARYDDHEGLYELLTGEEQLAEDAVAEREDRRAARGFVSRADAVAFLRLAEQTASVDAVDRVPARDAITQAYFRRLASEGSRPRASTSTLTSLLREYGVVASPRAALSPGSEDPLRARLAALPPALARRREQELLFLANVLVAADRGYTPLEAAQEVVRRCSAGLAALLQGTGDPVEVLRRVTCDQLFRVAPNAPPERAR